MKTCIMNEKQAKSMWYWEESGYNIDKSAWGIADIENMLKQKCRKAEKPQLE